ncbi:hypothetical protein [Pseudonocardia sp. NPDC046786]|uniref:hypothetical protein n=1 Tax=Pseudonocardia sp. NPDC046786 TaxID=3155471 RepID=UPI0033FD296B
MSEIVFFLTTLHSEDVREAYETWVREVDQPTAQALPGVERYRVMRLEGPVMDGVAVPAYNYIEVLEVSDLETYQRSLAATPASFFEQFRSHISAFDAVVGKVLQ